jgi:hypothetical protein
MQLESFDVSGARGDVRIGFTFRAKSSEDGEQAERSLADSKVCDFRSSTAEFSEGQINLRYAGRRRGCNLRYASH